MRTINVEGSYGGFTCDTHGNVLTPPAEREPEYADIVAVNVQEYVRHWGETADSFDILDLGLWFIRDGELEYVPPCEDFRQEVTRCE